MRSLASLLAIGLFCGACGKVTETPDANTGDDDVAPPDAADELPDADACAGVNPTGTITFTYTGAVQTFVVPDCETSIAVDAFGAQGGTGAAAGGLGGRAQATIAVIPGETLLVYVGGAGATINNNGDGGFNGGGGVVECCGTAPSGAGGGASDVRRGAALEGRIVVAGGGGGGGWQTFTGGGGGGLVGVDGTDQDATFQAGNGGTQTAGGAAGWVNANYPNEPGSLGSGGRCWHDGAGCGGGGGGYYGGGTGGFAGGGGGSSYIGAPGSTNTSTTASNHAGNGEVWISW
jgi:hypothetical protein